MYIASSFHDRVNINCWKYIVCIQSQQFLSLALIFFCLQYQSFIKCTCKSSLSPFVYNIIYNILPGYFNPYKNPLFPCYGLYLFVGTSLEHIKGDFFHFAFLDGRWLSWKLHFEHILHLASQSEKVKKHCTWFSPFYFKATFHIQYLSFKVTFNNLQ